ncbi:hypothetical protein GCM10023215_22780 [Pseudonocardia yuanmonensis]|uniref:Uncharacterized protein n=1 Tax=Pseudonocardia yuanmonensis TaxID=1095914 RepID=A0ABP8WCF8_9PSEU
MWFSASAVVPRLRAEWGIGEATAIAALAVSGTCCLLSPVVVGAGVPGLVAFCAVWGRPWSRTPRCSRAR